jgi:hypothetical protein
MTGNACIEVDHASHPKHGQVVAGDVFVSRKLRAEDRVVSVLSDGLGSGIKASVLATLTATMGLKYAASFVDVRKSAEIIMDTLPVCKVRKISYSTFTIVDVAGDGEARIIEHGNPPALLLRGDGAIRLASRTVRLERWQERPIGHSACRLRIGDRIVCLSDGVTQSGMGAPAMPLGWGEDAATAHALALIRAEPGISARRLAAAMVERAVRNDGGRPKDDVSCAVIHFRRPRRLLVLTGPPFARDHDAELAELVQTFRGRKAICGGTTASIVARRLARPVRVILDDLDPDLPPRSEMEGVDLITEGTLTLGKVAELLEAGAGEAPPANAAGRLLELLLESDCIDFVVGTRINEAHQDPNIPQELELRGTLVKRIARLLEEKHLKETQVRRI